MTNDSKLNKAREYIYILILQQQKINLIIYIIYVNQQKLYMFLQNIKTIQ